jgi:hypothetical protein
VFEAEVIESLREYGNYYRITIVALGVVSSTSLALWDTRVVGVNSAIVKKQRFPGRSRRLSLIHFHLFKLFLSFVACYNDSFHLFFPFSLFGVCSFFKCHLLFFFIRFSLLLPLMVSYRLHFSQQAQA